MTAITALLALALYLVCTLLLVWRIQEKPAWLARPITIVLMPGFAASALHLFTLSNTLFTEQGLEFGLFNAASTIGAVIGLLALLMSLKRKTECIAAMVLPIAALSILLELLFPVSRLLPPDSAAGLKIHVLVSIIAYSLLGLAALIALILAVQNHLLHHHHTNNVLRHLPPLQITEKLLFDSIIAGFIGLSLALGTGFVFLENMFAQHLVHKTILAVIAWIVFGILLAGHLVLGWRGRTAVRWTLSGFVVLMLAYFGSKLVLEILLAP